MEESGPYDFNRAIEKILHFMDIDRLDLAEREAREAVAQAPNVPGLHGLLADVLVRAEKLDEAEEEARVALSLDPESVQSLCVLGRIETQRGTHRKAEELYLEALKLDPESTQALSLYGYLLLKTGKLDKAAKVLRRAVELDPENESLHSLLSSALASKREIEGSTRVAGEGMRLNPDASDTQFAAGRAALASGKPFLARKHFRESVRIDPTNEGAAELFELSDQYCRWCCLPFYYYSLLLQRIPGAQFTIWGCFIGFVFLGRRTLPPSLFSAVVGAYILLCIYTWVAMPITRAWVRLRPAR